MSTVVAAKAALIATMETALTGQDCPVVWGSPDWEPDDMVVVQGASGTLAHAAMGATRPRDESYTLTATVSVYRGGTDQRLVTERAWAIFALIEAAVRANPTLSGAVQAASVAGFEMEEAPLVAEGDVVLGRICEVVLRVDVRARV